MANELFKRTEVNFGGAFTADKGLIVPNNGLTGVLMQNFQIQYGQSVSRIYELGAQGQPTNIYYIGGRASGSLNVAHVIGPGVSMKLFYESFSDVCKARNNDCKIQLSANACGFTGGSSGAGIGAAAVSAAMAAAAAAGAAISYKAKFCVLMSIGLSVASADFVINQQAQMMFSGLEVL